MDHPESICETIFAKKKKKNSKYLYKEIHFKFKVRATTSKSVICFYLKSPLK